VDERILETLSKVIDTRCTRRRRGQDVWKDWGRGIACRVRCNRAKRRAAIGRHGANGLTSCKSGVDERVNYDRAIDSPIVDSVTTAQARLAISGQIH
jgi:hypothetical protein